MTNFIIGFKEDKHAFLIFVILLFFQCKIFIDSYYSPRLHFLSRPSISAPNPCDLPPIKSKNKKYELNEIEKNLNCVIYTLTGE